MEIRRVAVTGMGLLCPLGNSLEGIWSRAVKGESGLSQVDSAFVKVAGLVNRDIQFSNEFMEPKEQSRLPDFLAFTLSAAKAALESANWNSALYDPYRMGCSVGATGSDSFTMEEFCFQFLKTGKVPPSIARSGTNIPCAYLSKYFHLLGTSLVTSSACSSSNHALINACMEIMLGRQDLMVAGGVQGPPSKMQFANFKFMKAYSTDENPQTACKPFDKKRDGIVLSEGAGFFVLEDLEKAQARGAKIWAEIIGFASTSDGAHIINPNGVGAAKCMQLALDDSGLVPQQVGHLNAHATGTPTGDRVETLAIKKVFGPLAYDIPVTAPKSMLGHMIGAASIAECTLSILALCKGVVPPTINLVDRDEACDLNYVSDGAIEREMEYALCNSFGFGGTNTSIVFKKI